MKHDYITDNVHHSPRKVRRMDVIILVLCFLLCGVVL